MTDRAGSLGGLLAILLLMALGVWVLVHAFDEPMAAVDPRQRDAVRTALWWLWGGSIVLSSMIILIRSRRATSPGFWTMGFALPAAGFVLVLQRLASPTVAALVYGVVSGLLIGFIGTAAIVWFIQRNRGGNRLGVGPT